MNGPSDTTDWAPIAVFAYNRPDKLAALMASLQSCQGFSESPVTIFVDGAKGPADDPAVQAVRDLVVNLRLPNVSWSFQQSNRGLRQSVYAGVSQVVRQYGRVVVLEDDLVLSPIALTYFNKALSRYETVDRVWSVVGYAYDAPALRGSTTTVALPFAHPWGWATWARAWNRYQLDNQPARAQLGSASFRSAFDMDGLYPFTAQLKNSIEGRVNSWFIHWYYTVFEHRGVSIFPPRRVLDNYGMSEGSHGGAMNPYDRLVTRPPLLDAVPHLCDPLVIDYVALDHLRNSHELRVQRMIARAGSAKRVLQSWR